MIILQMKNSLSSSSSVITIFFIFLFSILFHSSKANEIDHLLSFKSSIKDPTHSLSNWNHSTLSVCDFNGITCSPTKTHVLKINLSSKNLSGNLSSSSSTSLFRLPLIASIDLSANQLHGNIPEVVFSSMSLTYLNLSNNNITGHVSASHIKGGSRLETLDLSNNMISGTIPENIGLLSDMKYLDLGGNALVGGIPKSISNATKLEYLTLASNQLVGEIPNELKILKKMKWVYLGYNNLSGKIPYEFGTLTSLHHLDLVYNNLTGSIPSSFGNLTKLKYLFLYQNKLSGKIPPSIFTLQSLVSLDLSDNLLSGEIPDNFTSLQNLQVLHLFTNNLTGKIPTSISLLPHLQVLQLWSNNLHGEIPQNLGKTNNLTVLDLSTNSLSGRIPDSLCNSGYLVKLIIFSNSLSGGIPPSLGSCHSLTRIRLQNNSLSGGLPKGFTKLKNASFIDVSRNDLSGEINEGKWDMPMLQMLNLAKNKFVGGLPDLSSSTKLENLDLSENGLSSNIPPSYGNLKELMLLRLSRNEINGVIPEELTSCKKLVTLDLSHNGLTGPIPYGLGLMPVLGQLDLSQNKLTGEIPVNLGTANSLVEVNISYNHLRGVLPSTGAFLAINSSAVLGNTLCSGGGHSTSGLPLCKGDQKGPTTAMWWGLAMALGVIMLVATVASVCVCNTLRRRNRRKNLLQVQRMEIKDSIWEIQFFDPKASKLISIKDIVTKRNNDYDDQNSMKYVVEELNNVSNLWEEITQFGKIKHHPNVVKLVGACKSEKKGLLIYEKVEGKCLSEVVHGLSWENRRRIAIGIARALKFLHCQCSPCVLVGEMSPEKVIVDDGERVEAHLRLGVGGLFGLGLSKSFLSSAYVAPETKDAKEMTDKNDIYGFGIILVELLTGKGPTDAELGAHNGFIGWARYCYSDCHLDTWINPAIREHRLDNPNEIVEIMNLALQCTASDPTARPCSSDVVKTLESIMKTRRCVLGFEISK